MREIKYLSPTSLQDWESSPERFYLTRLADNRMEKFPQTQPMSIGSALDARWKNYLARSFYGDASIALGGQFHLETIFNAQVEKQHRDWAWKNSQFLMDCYIDSGAMADLVAELALGTNHRFEFDLGGAKTIILHETGEEVEVPLFGKPDCHFNLSKAGIVYDLKVNGYCSQSKTSPQAGFVQRRKRTGRGEWERAGEHKDAMLAVKHGITINVNKPMDVINKGWASQLTTYAWMSGEEMGSDFICGIEQFACGPPKMGGFENEIEVVSLRGRVTSAFQEELAQRYAKCWKCIQEGRIFPNLTLQENKDKIAKLDDMLNDPKERFMLKT